MKKPAIVQSVFEFAIREINALEGRIVVSEDDADSMLWEQAEKVVSQIDAGLSQRQLAEQWINARTGKPYDHTHVHFVVQVFSQLNTVIPRPRFRDAYNEIAHPSTSHHGNLKGDYEWYTPEEIIEAARELMGGIDLDPSSCEHANQIVKATKIYTEEMNGLEQPWHGRVFLNPPFAHPTVKHFAERLMSAMESSEIEQAVWLSNACVDTTWWQDLADMGIVCFHRGRVRFYGPDGTLQPPTLGQTIIYLGEHHEAFRASFASFGIILS